MEISNAVALYAAGLSTALAVAQGAGAWLGRKKVAVSADLVSLAGGTYGTPLSVRPDADDSQKTVAVEFQVRNLGGKPVQVLALVVESLDKETQTLHSHQITPPDLPIVLEPGTTFEVLVQKEHIDMLDSCTFLGIVDGTGRRHRVPPGEAASLVEKVWRLPTRVEVFQRRDDPTERVVAYQLAENARLTTRSAGQGVRRTRVIAERHRPVLETLLADEQPRVGLHKE